MGTDPDDIFTWDILDGLGDGVDDVSSPEEVKQTKCPDCKGKKVIYLFTTYETCTLCRGTGKIVIQRN